MVRKTSDSRSRHKQAKKENITGTSTIRGKTTRSRQREHEQKEEKEEEERRRRMAAGGTAQGNHDPTMAATHPPNCECMRLRPGMFLPASLQENDDGPVFGDEDVGENDKA